MLRNRNDTNIAGISSRSKIASNIARLLPPLSVEPFSRLPSLRLMPTVHVLHRLQADLSTRALDQIQQVRVRHFLIGRERRSEEHTSELQSLMRISYAVFCLKKKNK